MGLIVRLAKLFDGLGSSGEDVLKEPPMRGTSNKALAKGDECSKVGYCVWRKMMELRPEVGHDTSEEGVGRQGGP